MNENYIVNFPLKVQLPFNLRQQTSLKWTTWDLKSFFFRTTVAAPE